MTGARYSTDARQTLNNSKTLYRSWALHKNPNPPWIQKRPTLDRTLQQSEILHNSQTPNKGRGNWGDSWSLGRSLLLHLTRPEQRDTKIQRLMWPDVSLDMYSHDVKRQSAPAPVPAPGNTDSALLLSRYLLPSTLHHSHSSRQGFAETWNIGMIFLSYNKTYSW